MADYFYGHLLSANANKPKVIGFWNIERDVFAELNKKGQDKSKLTSMIKVICNQFYSQIKVGDFKNLYN